MIAKAIRFHALVVLVLVFSVLFKLPLALLCTDNKKCVWKNLRKFFLPFLLAGKIFKQLADLQFLTFWKYEISFAKIIHTSSHLYFSNWMIHSILNNYSLYSLLKLSPTARPNLQRQHLAWALVFWDLITKDKKEGSNAMFGHTTNYSKDITDG